MNGFYEIIESAVSWHNIIYTFSLSMISSLILGAYVFSIKKTLTSSIITFLIAQFISIVAFFIVRDKIQTVRLNEIIKEMNNIVTSNSYVNPSKGVVISNWREGLIKIKENPTEIGYYIKTIEYLEQENDYESSATLLELGLDFMNYDKMPTIICDKLQLYYKHLANRPKLDKDCNKIYEIR